jgi:hypothetical protein
VKTSQEVNVFDRVGEVVSVVLGALALAYLIYEIDKRKRKLSDLFHVLGKDDANLSAELISMVDRGELQPYTRGGRA